MAKATSMFVLKKYHRVFARPRDGVMKDDMQPNGYPCDMPTEVVTSSQHRVGGVTAGSAGRLRLMFGRYRSKPTSIAWPNLYEPLRNHGRDVAARRERGPRDRCSLSASHTATACAAAWSGSPTARLGWTPLTPATLVAGSALSRRCCQKQYSRISLRPSAMISPVGSVSRGAS
jgi:hypothetical protein